MGEDKITPVLMPKWGLSMEQGILIGWLVEEGASIDVGDEIMEVETDKIASAVEAADAGTLRRQLGIGGETYPVRALLGVLADDDVSDEDIEAYIAAYEVPSEEGDGEAFSGPQYEFIETNSGRIRFAKQGQQGPAILLIHGFGGDLDNWLFNIDVLSEKCQVYALDLPGHGQSSKSMTDPTLTGLANAVQEFMHSTELGEVHLVGHSMGAAVAVAFATKVPEIVKSLTLISAAGLGSEINSEYIDSFVRAGTRRELKPVLMQLFADPKMVNRNLIDELLKYKRLDGVEDVLAQLAQQLFVDDVQSHVLTNDITALGKETLIIWGAEDKVIPASHAENIDLAPRILISEAGHMVQMEKAKEVNELILKHVMQ